MLHEALSDEGEGFHITAGVGRRRGAGEAPDPSAALRLADTRMYAAKVGRPPEPEEPMSGALPRMLEERHPGLGNHLEEVAGLAVACAEALGLAADDIRLVERAAELHDIGKVGIPCGDPGQGAGSPTRKEQFMRRHSVIGERILGGVPSLERGGRRWSLVARALGRRRLPGPAGR